MSTSKVAPVRPALPDDATNDIDAYVDSLTDEQRAGVALAEVAFDLATLMDRLREGDSGETETAELAELRQQAASHFGQDGIIAQVGALQRYLRELGYALDLGVIDIDTGTSIGRLALPANELD